MREPNRDDGPILLSLTARTTLKKANPQTDRGILNIFPWTERIISRRQHIVCPIQSEQRPLFG